MPRKQKQTSARKSSGFPALVAGEKVKNFEVSAGFSVGDNNNVRKDGGDIISLSKGQAEYLMTLGAIAIKLDFGDDDAGSDEANNSADSNKAKAGAEAKLDGDESVGAIPPKPRLPSAR